MSLVKKIAVCTGFSEPDQNNEVHPIWEDNEIGAKASNVILETRLLGQNTVQGVLNKIFSNEANSLSDGDSLLALDENGKIYSTGIPVSWLGELYADWEAEHSTPSDEPEEPNESEEPNQNNQNNEEELNNQEPEEP